MITQTIGGVQGSNGTGLVTGTFNILGTPDDTAADVLALGVTNGATNGSGATGYKVVLTGDAGDLELGLSGSVTYRDGPDEARVDFNGFERFAFTEFKAVASTNNDLVDATGVTSNLSLDTGIGNDTVDFGSGDDTFIIGNKVFGNDTVEGGAGDDTMDLLTGVGAHLAASFTVNGTNLFRSTPIVAIAEGGSVTFTGFETIRTGNLADRFVNGYAATGLKSIEMGNGDDSFGWLTFNGDELDIAADGGNDTVNIGGDTGSGGTGLLHGTVSGGTGADKLALGVTNGHSGATGFKVVIEDDAESARSFKGAVQYTDGVNDGLGGTRVDFEGFEALTFSQANVAKNNDIVDATMATRNLTLDTGIGNDTVDFGSGADTFVISSKRSGNDTVDGGAGHDTLDLLSGVGAHLAASFTVNGTNLFQNIDSVATSGANSVSFTGFEVIKTGTLADTFVGGYAATALKSIEMGGGNDRFEWSTFNGDALDIAAGNGNDLVAVGGTQGSGFTGLINGTVDGGAGVDTLFVRFNNTEGATGNGFAVTFTGNNDGEVTYRGAENGPTTTFTSFETVTFDTFSRRPDLDDVVDARSSNAALTINTAAGNDTIIVAGGNDLLTGGLGSDTFAFTGTFGKDVITDFNVLEDKIALQSSVTGVDTVGSNTVITTADGTVTLNNVTGLDIENIDTIINTDFFA